MARETATRRKARCHQIMQHLHAEFPNPVIALEHRNPFELLIATILSAQCTDERVNKVTPLLFAEGYDPRSMRDLGVARIEKLIGSINFFRNKAKNIHGCCKRLMDVFDSQVPTDLDNLTSLPGVGRKTANVVLGSAFDTPGMVVDTHVLRISNRLAFGHSMEPVAMEKLLMDVVPKSEWVVYSHLLILHGRKTCKALKPACCDCRVAELCPSAGNEAYAWKF